MAFFTKEQARAASKQKFGGYGLEARKLEEAVHATRDYESFDVFLSHSMRDADLVMGVKLLLEQEGLSVYVDWVVDGQLDRAHVTKKTADLLRKRMAQCKSLMYVATSSAAGSKWMPWELGYFDGLRKGSVAILPLTDRAGEDFKGQEYLGLYPVVTHDYGRTQVNEGYKKAAIRSFGRGAAAWTY